MKRHLFQCFPTLGMSSLEHSDKKRKINHFILLEFVSSFSENSIHHGNKATHAYNVSIYSNYLTSLQQSVFDF